MKKNNLIAGAVVVVFGALILGRILESEKKGDDYDPLPLTEQQIRLQEQAFAEQAHAPSSQPKAKPSEDAAK